MGVLRLLNGPLNRTQGYLQVRGDRDICAAGKFKRAFSAFPDTCSYPLN